MKPIIFIACVLMGSICANAQITKPQIQEIQRQDTVLIMKEGKVLLIDKAKREAIEHEVMVAETKVTAKGDVFFADGTTATMQEGDIILADGRLVRAVVKSEKPSGRPMKV